MKTALITGINGQDASYLAELLVSSNEYDKVYGTVRRNSVPESQTTRISKLHENKDIELLYADLTDSASIDNVIWQTQPDELYHLAAQSHVRISFDLPHYTMQVNTMGTLNILEAVRKYSLHTRIYNAASSEMFGNSIDEDGYQRLSTPMKPVSPYGCSKLAAYNLCNNYRNSYDTFVCSGVLFNHESVRRGINFVTSKVIVESLKVKRGIIDKVRLGNLNACRDWGHAKDYVRAMYMMLQKEQPKDYVVATGQSRSVKDLVDYVFDRVGLTLNVLESDQKYLRPEELNYLRGDASEIKEIGWVERYSFYSMIDEMIEYWSKNIERCIYV